MSRDIERKNKKTFDLKTKLSKVIKIKRKK